MTLQERLHRATLMNRVLIPHQDDRSSDRCQQLREKNDDFLAAQSAPERTHTQAQSSPGRAQAHRPEQVNTLMVINAGTDRRCVPARCPGALEWRDPRKAAFIEKNQGCSQFMALFLSAASDSVYNARRPHHRVQTDGAAASGNSTRWLATGAKHRWGGTGHRTAPRSRARCDPASNNLQHSQRQTRRAVGRVPAAVVEQPINGVAVQAHVVWTTGLAAALHRASVAHCDLWFPSAAQLASEFALASVAPTLSDVAWPIELLSHRVS